MRAIGHLAGEAKAKAFGEVLFSRGIDNLVEPEGDGRFVIWVNDEEQLEEARVALEAYQRDPTAAEFQAAGREAARRRQQAEREQTAYEKRYRDARELFPPLAQRRPGGVTWFLLLASVGVTLASSFGGDREIARHLFISTGTGRLVSDLAQGEFWRLITPVFLHLSILHILFNLMWLWDLGSLVESKEGPAFFSAQVVVIAVTSNLAQYVVSGPAFGGMSGVVYGLLGYVWIRGRFDPRCGMVLHPTTVMMMMIWLGLGFTGAIPRMANTVHASGLIVGMLWGFLHANLRR